MGEHYHWYEVVMNNYYRCEFHEFAKLLGLNNPADEAFCKTSVTNFPD